MLEHLGIVTKINDNKLYVNMEVQSACAKCHAKGICTSLDKQTRQIIVQQTDDSINVDDKVIILMEEKNGFKAIFLGYFLPFLILVATLIITINIFDKEWLAGLLSIGMLILYYLILFLLRKKINKQFNFTIKKEYVIN